MLKHLGKWVIPHSGPMLPFSLKESSRDSSSTASNSYAIKALNLSAQRVRDTRCAARRRLRYEEDEDEEYGHNEQIGMLELYSQSARGEALIVHAVIDEDEVEVLIFKGFSSCLSYGTSSDPSKSILPARAVIKSIDRVKGPFNPSNIEYLRKDIAWEEFKTILPPN